MYIILGKILTLIFEIYVVCALAGIIKYYCLLMFEFSYQGRLDILTIIKNTLIIVFFPLFCFTKYGRVKLKAILQL